jgi:hypothetical protein
MFRSRIFHLYGDVTITGEGLQNLGLCSALRAFEQGCIFIVPHQLWHGASVFPVSSEGPPHLVASNDTQGDVENLFYPGSLCRWAIPCDVRHFILQHQRLGTLIFFNNRKTTTHAPKRNFVSYLFVNSFHYFK